VADIFRDFYRFVLSGKFLGIQYSISMCMYICIFRQTSVLTLVLYSLGGMLIVNTLKSNLYCNLQIFPADFPLKREAIEFCVISSHRNRSFAFLQIRT
jgi:hypothetical protein